MASIRVLIVDDHEIVRSGLRTLLSREEDVHVVGVAGTGEEALDLVERLHPEIALVDHGLPKMSGTELCRMIAQNHPDTAVIILTNFLRDEVVRSALEAGAKGYVYKDIEGRELKNAIRSVAQGLHFLDPKVAGRVIRWSRKTGKRNDLVKGRYALTPREDEILRLLARGETDREIAEKLGLSRNTVKSHVARIRGKLQVTTRAEAAVAASKMGLV